MQALFLANLELSENEGIYKKIVAEAKAIGHAVGACKLIMKQGTGSAVYNTMTDEKVIEQFDIYDTVTKLIDAGGIDLLYIRLLVPSIRFLKLLKYAKRRKALIYYEIPTYPYYAEQFRSSRKKYRAIAKIAIDALFSPVIYRYADHYVVIRSNSKIRLKPKMVEMTNGVMVENIIAKNYSKPHDSTFRMVTVGTLYPYHGYDRVLRGLAACKEEVNGVPVELHVIGASQTIDELKKEAAEGGLRRTFFHGIRSTDELNQMFENYDVGLGCLALHRRNADIDTTLKIIEYYCRGIPVVTSGRSPYPDSSVTIVVPDNEDAIDIKVLYDSWKKIPTDKIEELSGNAKAKFSWDNIMRDVLVRTGVIEV